MLLPQTAAWHAFPSGVPWELGHGATVMAALMVNGWGMISPASLSW